MRAPLISLLLPGLLPAMLSAQLAALLSAMLPALLPMLAAAQAQAPAQRPPQAPPLTQKPRQVLLSGTVPDEASKAALLARLRELYGPDQVVDQLAIGNVSQPPNWSAYVQRLIGPNLKLISKGQLKIDGNNVSLRGEVANEAQRQQIASDVAASLNPTYMVNNGLRVAVVAQNLLGDTLARRIIEFDSGKATLTPSGRAILDEMAGALNQVRGKKVEVIGHTDNLGPRERNLALSQARAEAVRTYLAGRGIGADTIVVSGLGPDRPVADNASADGRARNRRIEFRIVQ